VPFIAWHDPAGSKLGITYVLKRGASTVTAGQSQVKLAHDDHDQPQGQPQACPHRSYTLTVTVEDIHGQSESEAIALTPMSR
jgi:hypothetical protein